MVQLGETIEKFAPRGIALAQQRPAVARLFEGIGQTLRHALDRAQRRTQHQGSARAGLEQRHQGLHEAFGELRRLRFGHALRYEQQSLRGIVEGRLPTCRARVLQTELLGEVIEIAMHRQRGRGQHPGLLRLAVARKGLRHRQRRGMQAHMMQALLDPAHHRALRRLRRHAENVGRGVGAGRICADASRACGHRRGLVRNLVRGRVGIGAPPRLQRLRRRLAIAPGGGPTRQAHAQLRPLAAGRHQIGVFLGHAQQGARRRIQDIAQMGQGRVEHLWLGHGLESCLATRHAFQRRAGQAQFARGRLQPARYLAPARRLARIGQAGRFHDAAEVHQLMRGNAAAQKTGGGVGQLMRLVENHRVGLGQGIGHALFAQHQVGHEQGVVDHHHIGLLGLAARLDHEAVADARAVLAQAVFTRGRHALPDVGVFRHIAQIGPVAGLGYAGKKLDLAQLRNLGTRFQRPVVALQAIQVVVADVVAPPLEQGHRHRRGQGLAHARQIAAVELVLQGARAGGNEHLAALDDGRHQVGPGLADARAGFGHQRAALADGAADGLGQFDLRRSGAVAGQRTRQRTLLGKIIGDIGIEHEDHDTRRAPGPCPGVWQNPPFPAFFRAANVSCIPHGFFC